MNLLITGGRDFDDMELAFDAIAEIHRLYPISVIVHGNARGADKMADKVADTIGIDRIMMPANWVKHKKGAGPIRNRAMLDILPIDMILAFPGGAGTANMKTQAKDRGISILEATELFNDDIPF